MKRSSFGNCLRWNSFDPVAGEFQRVERGGVAGLHRGIDLGRGHAQAGGVDLEPVEFSGRLDQGGVAARGHVIDDGAGGALDIGRNLALGGEKRRKPLVEIGAASVEANGHGGFLGIGSGLCSMARRPMAVNPFARPSFRGDAQHRTRNLEIPGSTLARRRRNDGARFTPPAPGARRRDRWSRGRRCRGRSARIPGIRRPAAAPRHG